MLKAVAASTFEAECITFGVVWEDCGFVEVEKVRRLPLSDGLNAGW